RVFAGQCRRRLRIAAQRLTSRPQQDSASIREGQPIEAVRRRIAVWLLEQGNMADEMKLFSTSATIDAAIDARAMLKHSFYQAWSEGRLNQAILADYAKQYFHHVEAFPRAVSAVHTACPDRVGRRMLAENLAEEEGLGEGKSDHASLWMDFATGLGASRIDVAGVELNAETQNLIGTFARLSRKSYAAGLGALYAYESQLPAVSTTK